MKQITRMFKVLLIGAFIILFIHFSLELVNIKNKSQLLNVDEQQVANKEMIEPKIDKINKNEKGFDSIRKAPSSSGDPIFTHEYLSQEIINRIMDSSWKEGAPVSLEELSYVKVTYWGFDEQEHMGELIVHSKVAEEVVEIFKELYEAKFPIEKIRLIDEYAANDDLSMEDNNTSAFCFREITGSEKISKHGYGIAIDINPVQNPYIVDNKILPLKGKGYTDREDVRKGMIVQGDACYNAFVSRGWTWGGQWKTVKDYQHFEKKINF